MPPAPQRIREVTADLPTIVTGWPPIVGGLLVDIARLALTYASGDITEEEFTHALNREGKTLP